MLTVFEEARAVVVAEELDAGCWILPPVRWPAFEVLKNRRDACAVEKGHGILRVFVEIGIEDALIHHVGLSLDGDEHPFQVVRFEHCNNVRLVSDCLLHDLGMAVEGLLLSRDDLRDDREAIARGSLWEDRAVPAVFHVSLKYPSLGIAMAAGFVQSPC